MSRSPLRSRSAAAVVGQEDLSAGMTICRRVTQADLITAEEESELVRELQNLPFEPFDFTAISQTAVRSASVCVAIFLANGDRGAADPGVPHAAQRHGRCVHRSTGTRVPAGSAQRIP